MNAHTIFNNRRFFIGNGAAGTVKRFGYTASKSSRGVRVGIIGGGAAGLMAAHSLLSVGFENVTLFSPKELGIWSQANVAEGSRNNPRTLTFVNQELDAAPGDGSHVASFLNSILRAISGTRGFRTVKDKVLSVTPGNMNHTVITSGGATHEFQILINAIGTGTPKQLNDPDRMEIIGNEVKGALRWQKVGLSGPESNGQMFIFVGLGNSTAEMIGQLHQLMDEGYEVDYRILTHYSRDSIMNPHLTVSDGKKNFRVFRDLSIPDLTGFQGDLEHSRRDYFRALTAGRILPNVSKWGVKETPQGKVLTYVTDKKEHEVKFNQLYALTGYKHAKEDLKKFGLTTDQKANTVLYDYDGEVISAHLTAGEKRLHQGYYVLGAVADSPHNPNAIVIPGMLSSIPPTYRWSFAES